MLGLLFVYLSHRIGGPLRSSPQRGKDMNAQGDALSAVPSTNIALKGRNRRAPLFRPVRAEKYTCISTPRASR